MSSMKVIKKEEALANVCEKCAEFFRTHEVMEETPSYISGCFECRKCNLQVDMMGEKIAVIWKIT